MTKVVIAVVVIAVLVIAGCIIVAPQMTGTNIGQVTEIADTYSYTIEGEVSKPGTYVLGDVVSMSELIAAAGGEIHNTDTRSYFDEAVVSPGNTYYIGGRFDNTDICSTNEIVKVNINSDSVEQLTKVSGITSSIASSIVSYRGEIGTYKTIEDLLGVYGIGNATYRKIRNYVILHE